MGRLAPPFSKCLDPHLMEVGMDFPVTSFPEHLQYSSYGRHCVSASCEVFSSTYDEI